MVFAINDFLGGQNGTCSFHVVLIFNRQDVETQRIVKKTKL